MSNDNRTLIAVSTAVGQQLRELREQLERDNSNRNHKLESELNAARAAMDAQARHSVEVLEVHARRLLDGI